MNLVQGLIYFFDSSFFVALSTILTIGGAIGIYLFQKRQEKQQIARLLINEIRNAENSLQKLIEHSNDIEFPVITVLPQNSWNKYSHLFTNDLDQDDIDHINNFYSIAEEIEYIVKRGNKLERFLVQIEQRSLAIQNTIMNILANSTDSRDAEIKFSNFKNNIEIGRYHYSPKGFQTDFQELLRTYQPILETHAGTVLKRKANLKI